MVRDIVIWPDPVLKQIAQPRRPGGRRHPPPARRHGRDHVRRRRRRAGRAAGRRAEALHRHRHLAPPGGAEAPPPRQPARSSGPRGRPPTPRAASPSPARPRTWSGPPRSGSGRSTAHGKQFELECDELLAIAVQHENDHLAGHALRRPPLQPQARAHPPAHEEAQGRARLRDARRGEEGRRSTARRCSGRGLHTPTFGQSRATTQPAQSGLRAWQVRRPCQTSSWCALPQRSGGRSAEQVLLDAVRVGPGA